MNDLEPKEEDAATFGGMFWGDGLSSLLDRPSFLPNNIRKKTKKEIKKVYKYIVSNIFPILAIKP